MQLDLLELQASLEVLERQEALETEASLDSWECPDCLAVPDPWERLDFLDWLVSLEIVVQLERGEPLGLLDLGALMDNQVGCWHSLCSLCFGVYTVHCLRLCEMASGKMRTADLRIFRSYSG